MQLSSKKSIACTDCIVVWVRNFMSQLTSRGIWILCNTEEIPSSHVKNNKSRRRSTIMFTPPQSLTHPHNHRKCIVFLMRRIACSRSPLSRFRFPLRAPQKCVWERLICVSVRSFNFWGSHIAFWNNRVCVRVRISWGLSRVYARRPVFQLVGPKFPTQPTERGRSAMVLHYSTRSNHPSSLFDMPWGSLVVGA